MYDMSQNYRLRKCHLERNQVPTQTVMKKQMCPALADVYFKSMSPKLKVLAGLEPPLQGGGNSWCISPEDLLQGRVVLKPQKNELLPKLDYIGVDKFGYKLMISYREELKLERDRIMFGSSINWKQKLDSICIQHKLECAANAAEGHTVFIKDQIEAFGCLYTSSITKLQDLLLNAAVSKIKKLRDEITQKMQIKYEILLRKQATEINHKYNKKLKKIKSKLKQKFKKEIQRIRREIHVKLHDIKIEKHTAVEKLRKFMECQNLANQVYVALTERQKCSHDIETIKRKHDAKKKILEAEITYKGYQIKYAQEKEKKQIEFEDIWKKKVAYVLKSFQRLISYCLHLMPEHAEFFINLEKLMLLQLDAALECPSIHSIIMEEKEPFHSPIPRPRPFYLLGDKNYKPEINQALCPKHCTSSASQLPVIVVNKRFIYSACDNLEQLADKLKNYGYDRWGDDIQDYHDYDNDIPVKCALSQRLLELKLESSLMQLLQQEISNARNLPIECTECEMPQCFCETRFSVSSEEKLPIEEEFVKQSSPPLIHHEETHLSATSKIIFAREPKIESYSSFVKPKKCDCSKIAKKGLLENLPVYMRSMSIYEAPEMLNYETCTPLQLEYLIKNKYDRPPKAPVEPIETKKDNATQTSDDEHDSLCVCFSDESIRCFMEFLNQQHHSYTKIATASKTMKVNLDIENDMFRASKAAFKAKHIQSSIRASYFTHPGVSKTDKDITCICTH